MGVRGKDEEISAGLSSQLAMMSFGSIFSMIALRSFSVNFSEIGTDIQSKFRGIGFPQNHETSRL